MNGADDLLSTLQQLWPGAEVARATARRAAAGADVVAEVALAPSARSPRMAVPVRPRAATAAGLSRFHAGLGSRTRATRALAAGVGRLTGAAVLPDRLVVRGDSAGSLAEHLTRVLGEPVHLFVGVGSERVNRKPVVGVVDRRGRPVAFAKVGIGPVAATDVRTEAAALVRLAEVGWNRVRVPRLIDDAPWAGHPVLVATALPTSARQPAAWREHAPGVVLAEIGAAFAEPARAFTDLDWFAGLGEQFASLEDPQLRAVASACHEALADRDTEVAVGAWHGDLTPWNLAAHRGRVGVWDWERFETSVPLGLDALHHHLNAVTVRRGSDPDTVLAALGEVDVEVPELVGLYLAAVTARYLVLAQGPGGDRISARGAAFLDAWQRWSRTPPDAHRRVGPRRATTRR